MLFFKENYKGYYILAYITTSKDNTTFKKCIFSDAVDALHYSASIIKNTPGMHEINY